MTWGSVLVAARSTTAVVSGAVVSGSGAAETAARTRCGCHHGPARRCPDRRPGSGRRRTPAGCRCRRRSRRRWRSARTGRSSGRRTAATAWGPAGNAGGGPRGRHTHHGGRGVGRPDRPRGLDRDRGWRGRRLGCGPGVAGLAAARGADGGWRRAAPATERLHDPHDQQHGRGRVGREPGRPAPKRSARGWCRRTVRRVRQPAGRRWARWPTPDRPDRIHPAPTDPAPTDPGPTDPAPTVPAPARTASGMVGSSIAGSQSSTSCPPCGPGPPGRGTPRRGSRRSTARSAARPDTAARRRAARATGPRRRGARRAVRS